MKGYIDICHPYLRTFCETELDLGYSLIKNKPSEKLLGYKIDNNFSFYKHHKIICEKANSRLMELTRAILYMDTGKEGIKLNAFSILNLITAHKYGYSTVV